MSLRHPCACLPGRRGETTEGKGPVGNHGHAKLPAGGQRAVPFGFPAGQAELHFVARKDNPAGSQRRVRAADLRGVVIRHSNRPDKAGIRRVGKAIHPGLDCNRTPGKVNEVDIQAGQVEALEASTERVHQVPFSQAPGHGEELRENGGSLPAPLEIRQEPADGPLRASAAVHLRCIDQRNSAGHRCLENGAQLGSRLPSPAPGIGAYSKLADADSAFSQSDKVNRDTAHKAPLKVRNTPCSCLIPWPCRAAHRQGG